LIAAAVTCIVCVGIGCVDRGSPPAPAGFADEAVSARNASPSGYARFVEPANGDSVDSPFSVVMAVDSMLIEPAGEARENSGHYHILVDVPFIQEGNVIPTDDDHLHFGTGASEVEVALSPGKHTLRLQVANGVHIAYDSAKFGDTISVTVR
jgi:hypothetical protein